MLLNDRTYARVVAGAKIGLPLLALGLLSTLFLFARTVSTTPDIPFSEVDLRDRLRDQALTAPYYSGTTEDGTVISFKAARARPDMEIQGRAIVESVDASFQTNSGALIGVTSAEAVLNDRLDSAELTGSVRIESSTGYTVTTEAITAQLSRLHAETAGKIEGVGPPGRFSAGRMVLTSDADGAAQMIFTDGISLRYDPAKEE